jgi:glycosyltransferase involved in cell wall biosynthesis
LGYLLFCKTPKKVIVQSPPLLLSFLSVLVLSLKNKKIILNISDLWPLAAIELKAVKAGSFSHKVSLFMERFIYQKATVIIGQSEEIITHVKTLFPSKKAFLYRNFPDHKSDVFTLKTIENEPIKLFFAGLLGIAQGVSELCRQIDLKDLNIELHLFGDGAEKAAIESLIADGKNPKIVYHGMMDRKALHETLETFDIALVPLKTRIYGSVPSKIFEYTALGFPVLYFGGGEGENIVEENQLGWVASVGNFEALNEKLVAIAQLNKNDLALMKTRVFNKALLAFDLDNQLKDLIEKGVF